MIGQRRGRTNRLGLAVQLCLLRFPDQGLLPGADIPQPLLGADAPPSEAGAGSSHGDRRGTS